MYEQHFGLRFAPFGAGPDPTLLFLGRGHAEALAALEVGVRAGRGFVTLVGEVGTGKTTLLHALLTSLDAGIRTAFVWDTLRPLDDIVSEALDDFGAPREGKPPLVALRDFIRGCAAEHTTAALVIDEAQNLSDEAFETLRLVSNYESWSTKLLNIVLVGQPELDHRLRRPHLRQLAERVAVRCHVNPLGRAESRQYLAHRLERAGGSAALFTPPARRVIVHAARGIPRRLNILAHNALLAAYGAHATRVTRAIARAAVRDWEGRGLVTLRHGLRGGPAPALAAAGTMACAAVWLGQHPGLAPTAPPQPVASPPSEIVRLREAAIAPPTTELTRVASTQAPAAPVAPEPPRALVAPEPPTAPVAPEPPAGAAAIEPPVLAVPTRPRTIDVRVPRGATLSRLAQSFYGDSGPRRLARIQRDNPQITHPDFIRAGDVLRLTDPRKSTDNE